MFKFNVSFRDNIVINIEINNKKSPILHFENCYKAKELTLCIWWGQDWCLTPAKKVKLL